MQEASSPPHSQPPHPSISCWESAAPAVYIWGVGVAEHTGALVSPKSLEGIGSAEADTLAAIQTGASSGKVWIVVLFALQQQEWCKVFNKMGKGDTSFATSYQNNLFL